jgi:hypothetical protein
VLKGTTKPPFVLDGREVPVITAYLFHAGGSDDPAQLRMNAGRSFQGSTILGMGFTFDDTDKKGLATPLEDMQRLITDDPRNGERIFPYIGGEELNDSPMQSHHRYVINFEDWPLKREDLGFAWSHASDEKQRQCLRAGVVPLDYSGAVAEDFPELLEIIEKKVKPDRIKDNRENYARNWWQFAERRPGLVQALRSLNSRGSGAEVLAVALTSNTLAFVFLPANRVFAHSLVVFPHVGMPGFCVMQSRIHRGWALFFSSKMKDDSRYIASDCFETFPFPLNMDLNHALNTAGEQYYEFRNLVMKKANQGLTAVYNRFHDPLDDDPDIAEMRRLHEMLDRAVLKAYDWDDIEPQCQFIPEFDKEETEDEPARRAREKYLYRWPDELRDEVLVRILKLNRQRALEEGQLLPADGDSGLSVNGENEKKKKAKATKTEQSTPNLFATGKGDA